MSKLHEILCTYYLWPWLGISLTTMHYVIYFRFCGWFCSTCYPLPQRMHWSAVGAVEALRIVASTAQAADECIRRRKGVTGAKRAISDFLAV